MSFHFVYDRFIHSTPSEHVNLQSCGVSPMHVILLFHIISCIYSADTLLGSLDYFVTIVSHMNF
jgi:hypothetical protein